MKTKATSIVLFGLIFLIILVSNVLACQYTEKEFYTVQKEAFYHNGEFLGYDLNLSELIYIKDLTSGVYPSFRVYNDLSESVTLNLTYARVSHNPGYNGGNLDRNLVITLGPRTNELITDDASCSSFVQCSITEIKYVFIEPNEITSESVEITENRTICKICPNNKPCLDDGAVCSLDIECGIGFCNPAKTCGQFSECPEGQVLKNNVCVDNFLTTLKKNWYVAILVLLLAAGIWYFAIYRRKKEEEKAKEAKKERDDAIKEKQELETNITDLNDKIKKMQEDYSNKKERFEKDIKNLKNKEQIEIRKLNEKRKNASLEAQKAIDKEVDKIREDYNKRVETLNNSFVNEKQKIEELIEGNNRKLKEANEKRFEIEQEIEKTKKLTTQPFLNKQRIRVLLNQNGYEICSWDKNKLFHIWWYEKNSHEIVNTKLFNIHHIDGDRRNNEYYNLIKIDKDIHHEIHRYNKKWLNYSTGVEILKKYHISIPERLKQH